MRREIEAELLQWKDNPQRLPLILRGARQVGKSFIIEKFGTHHFDSVVTANFEYQPDLASCFETFDPNSICAKLEILLNKRIIPGRTLLFLDEIQNCPKAIMALRYFKEKLPSLHTIAAGSLLEFVLHEEKFSFPVGRVGFLYLKPLSFREYLVSHDQGMLCEWLRKVNIDNFTDLEIHQLLMTFLRQYFLIGGMPAVVKSYLEQRSFLECQKILKTLLETYQNDFPKYATKAQYKYLQKIFEKAPALVGQHFKYAQIDPETRSRDLKIALEQLEWAGLLSKIYATNASGLPLQAHIKENKFKLLFLDIGLMNLANRTDLQMLWDTNLTDLNAGAQAEQFVGQELLAYAHSYSREPLFYWQREKKDALAEVDYVIQAGSAIIPIKVKAGTTGRLKSLVQFLEEKKSPFAVRISQHPLSFHDRILSVPFYLIQELPRLIQERL